MIEPIKGYKIVDTDCRMELNNDNFYEKYFKTIINRVFFYLDQLKCKEEYIKE